MTAVWVLAELATTGVAEASLETLGEAVDLARPGRPGVLAVGPASAIPSLAALGAHGTGRTVLLGLAVESAEAVAAGAAAWLARQPHGPPPQPRLRSPDRGVCR